jgi:hypothetical protein
MPTRSRPPESSHPDPVLIRTKLEPPVAQPVFVERPRLLDRLDEALEHRVTLVSAPPGFGKTTLVAQWLDRRSPPCAWLSVDSLDDDAERFARYLVAAIEAATTHRLPETAALLAARERPPFNHRLEVLASEMARLDGPLLLVLARTRSCTCPRRDTTTAKRPRGSTRWSSWLGSSCRSRTPGVISCATTAPTRTPVAASARRPLPRPSSPRCGSEMRVIGFITRPALIDRILDHLRRRDKIPRPLATPA